MAFPGSVVVLPVFILRGVAARSCGGHQYKTERRSQEAGDAEGHHHGQWRVKDRELPGTDGPIAESPRPGTLKGAALGGAQHRLRETRCARQALS